MTDLLKEKCEPCEGGIAPLTSTQAEEMLQKVLGWELDASAKMITRVFEFKNFWRVMGFVNAVGWMAQGEGHHPDMEVSYNRVVVHYTTHAIGGLSANDFICAAKADEIYKQGPV